MKNQVTIDVQFKDIIDFRIATGARRRSLVWYSSNCPISKAVGHEFATQDVLVEHDWTESTYVLTVHGQEFQLTKAAVKFIQRLDALKRAMPFKFTLRARDHRAG